MDYYGHAWNLIVVCCCMSNAERDHSQPQLIMANYRLSKTFLPTRNRAQKWTRKRPTQLWVHLVRPQNDPKCRNFFRECQKVLHEGRTAFLTKNKTQLKLHMIKKVVRFARIVSWGQNLHQTVDGHKGVRTSCIFQGPGPPLLSVSQSPDLDLTHLEVSPFLTVFLVHCFRLSPWTRMS